MTKGSELARTVAKQTIEFYTEVARVASANIVAMEKELRSIEQEWLRERYKEIIEASVREMKLLESFFDPVRKGIKNPETRTVVGALQAGAMAAALVLHMHEAMRLRPQANLEPFPKLVTDEQILAVINDPRFKTRQQQADRLGVEKRTLERRISKLRRDT